MIFHFISITFHSSSIFVHDSFHLHFLHDCFHPHFISLYSAFISVIFYFFHISLDSYINMSFIFHFIHILYHSCLISCSFHLIDVLVHTKFSSFTFHFLHILLHFSSRFHSLFTSFIYMRFQVTFIYYVESSYIYEIPSYVHLLRGKFYVKRLCTCLVSCSIGKTNRFFQTFKILPSWFLRQRNLRKIRHHNFCAHYTRRHL